jgi:hypothetical protein
MDNQKLMQILLKDAGEMEKIISEIRETGNFDPLDMELLQTRISGLRHLLEVVCRTEVVPNPAEYIRERPVGEEKQQEEVISTEPTPQPSESQAKLKKERKPVKSEPVRDQPSSPSGTAEPLEQNQEKEPSAIEPTSKEELAVEVPLPKEEKHILAEKFVAGKSINDLLQEKSKIDSKFAPLPLSSLATGIGTNERFLFTRELFEGNMERFNETIHTLDAMHSIQEATGFLRENFTWDKNETSLRFIELIRRRFMHEM